MNESRSGTEKTHEQLLEEIETAQRASEASSARERATRTLLDATTDAVMLCEADGTVVVTNTAGARRFALSPDELVGTNVFKLMPPAVMEARHERRAEVARTGDPMRFQDERDGRVLENTIYPVASSAGAPTRFAIFSQDITDRKQAEKNQRELEVLLQRAQKLESLGILAGGIAHDFNNILTGLLGNADLALCQLPADSPLNPLLQDVKKEARRAADLTNQMLAYSGHGKFVVEDVDVNAMVEDMSSLLGSSTSKKAELRYILAPELPAVRADATQIQQILLNLVSNASDALGESEGLVTVRTYETECGSGCLVCASLGSELPEGRYVTIEVTDDGCGMDDETRSLIFDPFFTTKFTGRGLGLAAVQGIVRAHEGAILVASESGKGTTFKVLLPALDHTAARRVPATTKTPWRGTGTVLIADDESMVRRVTTEALVRAGFTVLTASDGAAAIEVFAEHRDAICCVLLDLKMPHMDGAEAYEAIRRLSQSVPVILISGYSEQTSIESFKSQGLAGFIQKPFDASTLTEKVRDALALE